MISKSPADSANRSVVPANDRRQFPRYGFMAVAELSDPDDAKLVPGKVTQISRSGCYVETPKTFPVGTSLKAIIFRDERTFVAKACIIHVQEQMGMGIAFLDTPADQLKVLDSWLADFPSGSGSSGSHPVVGR